MIIGVERNSTFIKESARYSFLHVYSRRRGAQQYLTPFSRPCSSPRHPLSSTSELARCSVQYRNTSVQAGKTTLTCLSSDGREFLSLARCLSKLPYATTGNKRTLKCSELGQYWEGSSLWLLLSASWKAILEDRMSPWTPSRSTLWYCKLQFKPR